MPVPQRGHRAHQLLQTSPEPTESLRYGNTTVASYKYLEPPRSVSPAEIMEECNSLDAR